MILSYREHLVTNCAFAFVVTDKVPKLETSFLTQRCCKTTRVTDRYLVGNDKGKVPKLETSFLTQRYCFTTRVTNKVRIGNLGKPGLCFAKILDIKKRAWWNW